MSLVKLLFSFEGRTRRSTYWIYSAVAMVVYLAASVAVNYRAFIDEFVRTNLPEMLIGLVFVGIGTAVLVKRLKDFNGSPAIGYAIGAICALLAVGEYAGVFGNIISLEPRALVYWVASVITLIACIVIGCIPGTNGPNAHGGDPRPAKPGTHPAAV